jgi:putative DNA methylase
VRFEVVEAANPKALGFDPDLGSKGGNATCPFCGAVADVDYVKSVGRAGHMGDQLVAVVAGSRGSRGWVFLSPDQSGDYVSENTIRERIKQLLRDTNLTAPEESIAAMPDNSFDNSLGITVRPYGIVKFSELFSPRQLLFHLQTVALIRSLPQVLHERGYDKERQQAILTMLACVVDRAVDFGCRLCVWNPYKDSGTTHAFGRQVITMVWDFSEVNPFNKGNASWSLGLDRVVSALGDADFRNPATVMRGSATALPVQDESFDAIVCDPPYYDNVPYSDISDFFYVWLKRSVGPLYSEHFAASNAPKKSEAIADAGRHGGSKEKANASYESMMAKSFAESHRVLKKGGHLVIVYAHKTTLGWATLVEALRRAGFTVVEAWPLDTERPGRLRAQESAALASSIFLVARKREGNDVGTYDQVRPDLEALVQERVNSLWAMGIGGADLVISCVGAGLRAFTKFAEVEYANG